MPASSLRFTKGSLARLCASLSTVSPGKFARSPSRQQASIEYENAVLVERDRRLAILLDTTAHNGQRPQSSITLATCKRMANAWMGMEMLNRSGVTPTGKAIARWLIDRGMDGGIAEATLTTRVHESMRRIKDLERPTNGGPVWSKFKFKPAPRLVTSGP